jgi:pyruvate/2-oxoacid:ferredoxin oxidoreductase beta subunit/Pyruvate/2-oxoacid:ferredoxin oxidoreductase gamma subunit
MTYIDETTLPYPFCPGCGHTTIVKALDVALVQQQIDPHNLVIVTDIGCQGLSDKFFATNALHGLHGRSVTYATGVKLANPDLHVVALIGDGGCGIGGHHLINAARRNIGITVIVFNNLNFGMTGGQHSVATPPDALTATTPFGNLEQPLDICSTVAVNGAGLVVRTTMFDKDLPNLIATAMQHDGFSLIDIWELCTAYFVPSNKFKKETLLATLDQLNFPTGVLQQRDRPEYSRSYRVAYQDKQSQPIIAPHCLETKYPHALNQRQDWVIAGVAGLKIGSAAAAFCRGAILSGLWTTQRNDYPVTVRSGHSISEVIVSPDPVLYAGITSPDIVIALFPEGLAKEKARIAKLNKDALVFVTPDLLPIDTQAHVITLDFSKTDQQKSYWTLMALVEVLRQTGIYPVEALQEAVAMSSYAEKNLAAMDAASKIIVS